MAIGAMGACFDWWRRVLEELAARAGAGDGADAGGDGSDAGGDAERAGSGDVREVGDGAGRGDAGGVGDGDGAVDVAVEFRGDVCRRMLAFLERGWTTVRDMVGDGPVEKAIGLLGELCDDKVTMDRLLAIVDDAIERGSRTTWPINGVPVSGYGARDWVLLRLDLLKF